MKYIRIKGTIQLAASGRAGYFISLLYHQGPKNGAVGSRSAAEGDPESSLAVLSTSFRFQVTSKLVSSGGKGESRIKGGLFRSDLFFFVENSFTPTAG